MNPNLKYYVVSIAAIFLALGIGIYIGFTLDAHNLLVEQKDDIVAKIEEKFEYLSDENVNLKQEINDLENINDQYEKYIENVYEVIIKDRLKDANIAIIETNDDYVYSGIGKTLELAGANVVNITTIKDKFINEGVLKEINDGLYEKLQSDDLVGGGIINLTRAIINGKEDDFIDSLREKKAINLIGSYDTPIDYLVIAGGAENEDANKISKIDKNIIDLAHDLEVSVIGIEKENVNYSYMDAYKNYRISTVDNVDSIIGKTALILSMEGRAGNYGIKPGAQQLLPNLEDYISE